MQESRGEDRELRIENREMRSSELESVIHLSRKEQ